MIRRMGILDACQARAAPIEEVYFYTATRRLLRRERTAALARTLGGYLLFRRADLQAALYELVRDVADIRFGTQIAEVRRGGGLRRGEPQRRPTERADILVGADGVHSRVRGLVFGEGFERMLGGYYIAILADAPPRPGPGGAFLSEHRQDGESVPGCSRLGVSRGIRRRELQALHRTTTRWRCGTTCWRPAPASPTKCTASSATSARTTSFSPTPSLRSRCRASPKDAAPWSATPPTVRRFFRDGRVAGPAGCAHPRRLSRAPAGRPCRFAGGLREGGDPYRPPLPRQRDRRAPCVPDRQPLEGAPSRSRPALAPGPPLRARCTSFHRRRTPACRPSGTITIERAQCAHSV